MLACGLCLQSGPVRRLALLAHTRCVSDAGAVARLEQAAIRAAGGLVAQAHLDALSRRVRDGTLERSWIVPRIGESDEFEAELKLLGSRVPTTQARLRPLMSDLSLREVLLAARTLDTAGARFAAINLLLDRVALAAPEEIEALLAPAPPGQPPHRPLLHWLLCELRGARVATPLLEILATKVPHMSLPSKAVMAQSLVRHLDTRAGAHMLSTLLLSTRGMDYLSLKAVLELVLGSGLVRTCMLESLRWADVKADALQHMACEALLGRGAWVPSETEGAAAPASHSRPRPNAQLVVNVGDTLLPLWYDTRYPPGHLYPGASAFVRALGRRRASTAHLFTSKAGAVSPVPEIRLVEGTLQASAALPPVAVDAVRRTSLPVLRTLRAMAPESQLLLLGDTAQHDASAFLALRALHPGTVRAILLHDPTEDALCGDGQDKLVLERTPRLALFKTYCGAAAAAADLHLLSLEECSAVAQETVRQSLALPYPDDAPLWLREGRLRMLRHLALDVACINSVLPADVALDAGPVEAVADRVARELEQASDQALPGEPFAAATPGAAGASRVYRPWEPAEATTRLVPFVSVRTQGGASPRDIDEVLHQAAEAVAAQLEACSEEWRAGPITL